MQSRLSATLDSWDQQELAEYAGVSAAIRKKAKEKGWALDDESYPIMDVGMLKAAAILAASGHGNVSAAKALIRKRAKELGVKLESLSGFGKEKADAMKTCPTCGGSGKVTEGY